MPFSVQFQLWAKFHFGGARERLYSGRGASGKVARNAAGLMAFGALNAGLTRSKLWSGCNSPEKATFRAAALTRNAAGRGVEPPH
jgi:hypothetical protein